MIPSPPPPLPPSHPSPIHQPDGAAHPGHTCATPVEEAVAHAPVFHITMTAALEMPAVGDAMRSSAVSLATQGPKQVKMLDASHRLPCHRLPLPLPLPPAPPPLSSSHHLVKAVISSCSATKILFFPLLIRCLNSWRRVGIPGCLAISPTNAARSPKELYRSNLPQEPREGRM